MRVQAGFLTLFSVLRGVTALYDLPILPLARSEQFTDLFDTVQSDVLKRSTHDASFPLNFNVANKVLSSGTFHGAKLTAKCVQCSTTGEVIASAMLPNISDIDITHPGDIFDTSMLGLTFNGVGATIDLDLSAAGTGDFSVPLLKTESPIGVSGPGFQLGVVFSVDLVLKITGKVETEGGFKVTIPDGSSFIIPFDQSKPNIAKFNGASASLLPISVKLPATVTAALQLKVSAGVMLPDLKVVDAKALAGATISIPEVILKESVSFPSNKTCAVPVSAELNINAGVFVDIGADIGGINLGDFNPTASTTLFAASTSTCLGGKNSTTPKTSSKAGSSTKTTTTSKPRSTSATPTGHSSFHPPSSSRPTPTTLTTSRRVPPHSGSSPPGAGGSGAPSSFAVLARTYAKRSAYPITLQSLATPITNFAAATPPATIPAIPVPIIR